MPRAIREEIKLKVLERVIGGESVAAIAKDCRLSTSCIHNWVRKNSRKIKKARKIRRGIDDKGSVLSVVRDIAEKILTPLENILSPWEVPLSQAKDILAQRQNAVQNAEQVIGHLEALRELMPGGN